MDIKDCRIDMMVKAPNGYDAKIVEIQKSGRVFVDFSPRGYNYMPFAASELTPVSNPCTDPCRNCQRIAELKEDRDNWKAAAEAYSSLKDDYRSRLAESRRNAAYWREELTKLQNDALAECKPLAEVAKIYVTVRFDASHMIDGVRKVQWKLLSDDAKIICELLEGSGPLTSWQIAERLHVLEERALRYLIEAREAGRIALVNGEYEIVRD